VREVAGAMKGYYLARALPRPLAWLGDAVLARRAKKLLTEGTAEVIAKLTDNPRLRAVLAAQWGYYGSPPSRSSFAIQALVVKHFMHGGYYPVGGSARIAETLLGTVAEAGGWTRLRADVTEILIEGGRACGVRLASGEELRAPEIVSAAGVLRTMKSMLPESYRTSAWGQSLEALRPASAHVCLYIGFKGDITEAGASAANKWFYDTWDMEQEAWPISPDSELEDAPCLYTSFPSLKDPEHDPGPELRHTGEVVTFVPWESFEAWLGTRWKRRGDDYEAFKQRIQEKLLAQFLERMPGLADMVEYVELSTPLSTDTFCRPMRGSIYGIEPTPERFANSNLKPRSPLPGLTFAGSEVTAVGVIGALIGGVLAAASLAPIESFRFVKNET
jgi:all-trans-retinol 13,14-reductase